MNKKGLTLIEIIVSIALISIVMVFLFQIVITIKNANDRQNNSSNNKVSVLIITREVQKDLDSFGLESTPTANCDFDDNSNNIIPATASKVNCVKILYNSNNAKNNEGYILYYENNNKYFLAYKRGKGNVIETQTVREISVPPEENLDIKINRAGNDNDFSVRINVPIRDDSENYDLDINYIYTKAVKYQVKVISENGLALNIKGNGKYYPNDIVNVSFDYDSEVNQLESVECINNLCQTSNNFSFIMPDEDVVITINIKADIVAPTCSLELNDTNIVATYSDDKGISYFGWDSSYSGEQVDYKAISAGTHTFYVKDTSNNKSTCSIDVTKTEENKKTTTSQTSATKSFTGSCYCCKGQGSSTVGSYVNCNSSTGTCSCPGGTSVCNKTCTAKYDCPAGYNPVGSVCQKTITTTEYNCGSGYTKYNNSWCYKKD